VNIKTTLKASVAAAALFAIAAPVATTANAADDTFSTGNKNSLTMSGYISRGLYWADDGPNSGLFNTTGETAGSRVRWVASAKFSETVDVGGLLEYELPHSNHDPSSKFNDESGATQGEETFADAADWAIRRENVWISHKTMGKITLGKTTNPSDGGWRVNFAKNGGTGAATDYENVGGSIEFVNGTSYTAVTVNASRDEVNPGGAVDAIRYDLPTLPGGLVVGVSMDDNGSADINGKITGKTGNVTTAFGLGYKNTTGSSTTTEYALAASAGVLLDSGFHASVAVGMAPAKLKTATNGSKSSIGVMLGYNTTAGDIGATGISLGWHQSKNTGARGQIGTTFAFTLAQYFDSIGATAALVFRTHQYENERLSHTSVNDVDTLGIQTVFNF